MGVELNKREGGGASICNTYLVVVSSLLDECINYFLRLLVAFLLQVSDECVQISRSIICLHNGLVGLDDESNACKYDL